MIDYKLLYEAGKYYEGRKFKRIEVPWSVPSSANEITAPGECKSYRLPDGNCLVGSAEQSFLYLYMRDMLPEGRFQTVTPCFRNDEYDFLHDQYFMKCELISTETVTETELEIITEHCLNFYMGYFPREELSVVDTEDGYDINVAGNELGSYGIRECEFLKWIYATGCAEPRTTKLRKLHGLSRDRNRER